MTKTAPILGEALIYLFVAAFFACLMAGSVTHRHGGSCGHASHAQAEAP